MKTSAVPSNNPKLRMHLFGSNRLISYAILLTTLFFVSHLAGFREYAGILSGTASIDMREQFYGAVYILLHVCFVFIAPILLLAAALFEIWSRWKGGKSV